MRILVTAGPTREYFDSVRFLSNPSSGKMGYAIAGEAVRHGHDVQLLSGPVDLPEPAGADITRVVSAQEMFEAACSLFSKCHAAIMTAAVCDYRPTRRLTHKLKKRNRIRPIHLQPTTDICAHLGKIKQHRIVVGFAMEDRDHHVHAEAKLKEKRCDAIVLNGLENVGGDRANIEILRADHGWLLACSGTKRELAVAVVDLVQDLVGRRG